MQNGTNNPVHSFFGLVQKRSKLAVERFKQMSKDQIREFLFYVGAVLTWVESKDVSICDVGPSFSGMLRLAYNVCPEAEPTLHATWSRNYHPKRFEACANC